MIKMNKKAQAVAEIAIYGSLLLLVLGVLLNYSRSLHEQQIIEQQVFRQALKDAHGHQFQVKDIYDKYETNYGARLSYSKTQDKQAGLLFEPNRRTYAAGYTVFWSGAEDAPEINQMKVNEDSLPLPARKKLTCFRSNYAEETPDKELEMNIVELIVVVVPGAVAAFKQLGRIEWIKKRFGPWWEKLKDWIKLEKWGPATNFGLRLVQFGLLLDKYNDAVKKLEKAEDRRRSLESQDEQFSKWGWRVSTEKDRVDGIEPGKWYVKEIDAQIYETQLNSDTVYDYTENKAEDRVEMVNRRRIYLRDTVSRRFKMRYDVTEPDPTIDLANHTYEYLDDVYLNQGLGQDRLYRQATSGTVVTTEQTWRTPN